MLFLKHLLDPAILIIIATFTTVVVYSTKKYNFVNKNLIALINFLEGFKKSNLVYRFGEFDNGMSQNDYVSNLWIEFKDSLLFSESVSLKQKNEIKFENISQQISHIQTTTDPLYFFNEDNLVLTKYNSKFIQIAPTLLTGLGPLFTFLNIAIAFTKIDFSTSEATISSVSHLMSSMQVAALCSVLAVGFSLIFMFIEKLLYNYKCKVPLLKAQQTFTELFNTISSEKFLVELLKETKVQNNALTDIVSELPLQFKNALDKSLSNTLVPYMENLVFGMNNLKESLKEKINKDDKDIVDDLF